MEKVLVVEGKNDCARIKQIFPDLPILITNGSDVNDSFLDLIKKLSVDHEIILFLDPDYSGEYIRRKITAVCPNASHLFVNKKDAISRNRKKVGVEHVRLDLLKEILSHTVKSDYHENIHFQDLYELGLIGDKESRSKREKLCRGLKIGYVNGKQLAERLNLFNITLDEVKKHL
jgi:ribonuclease M5